MPRCIIYLKEPCKILAHINTSFVRFAGEIGAAEAAITAAAEATEVGAEEEEEGVVAVTMMAEVEDTVEGKGEACRFYC